MVSNLTDDERHWIEVAFGAEWLARRSDRLAGLLEAEALKSTNRRSPAHLATYQIAWPWFVATRPLPAAFEAQLDFQYLAEQVCQVGVIAFVLRNIWPTLAPATQEAFRQRLREQDRDRFQQVLYELRIGAIFHVVGYNTSFIEPGNGKRADIRIKYGEETIFVECKKKAYLTEEDIALGAFWGRFHHPAQQLLAETQRSASLVVTAWEDPKEMELDTYLNFAREALSMGGNQTLSRRGQAEVQVTSIAEWDVLLPANANIEFPRTRLMSMVFKQNPTPEEGIRLSQVMYIGLGLGVAQDRTPGVISVLRNAVKQLPAESAGIVCVEVAIAPDHLFEQEADRVAAGLATYLHGQNTRITAILLTASGFEATTAYNTVRYKQLQRVIWHPTPRTVLPAGFTIPTVVNGDNV